MNHPGLPNPSPRGSGLPPQEAGGEGPGDVLPPSPGPASESAATIGSPPPVPLGIGFPDAADPQLPADVAIVVPTVLRPVLTRAIDSIYAQDCPGRLQILIGVDRPLGDLEPLLEVLALRPSHVAALVLQLPWSTSARHGGVHTAMDTGALRAILSFMANSRAVTYLDDDNIMLPRHLRLLHSALQGKAWAWSRRMLVDERNGRDLAVDRWDSVGPDQGRIPGGFVDTNCLMLDKVLCAPVLGRWAESGQGRPGLTADRFLFSALRTMPHGRVEEPTVRYFIRPTNVLHQFLRSGREF